MPTRLIISIKHEHSCKILCIFNLCEKNNFITLLYSDVSVGNLGFGNGRSAV